MSFSSSSDLETDEIQDWSSKLGETDEVPCDVIKGGGVSAQLGFTGLMEVEPHQAYVEPTVNAPAVHRSKCQHSPEASLFIEEYDKVEQLCREGKTQEAANRGIEFLKTQVNQGVLRRSGTTLREISYMVMGGDSQARGMASPSFISSPRMAFTNALRFLSLKEQTLRQKIETVAPHYISPLGMAIALRLSYLSRVVQALKQNRKIVALHCILPVRKAIILR